MIVDCAVYKHGIRVAHEANLPECVELLHANGGFLWIGLFEPSAAEFAEVTSKLDLHPLAVEDAIHAHQRPKIERYGETTFVVLKPVRYVDHEEIVDIGQIMLFVADHFIVTVRHGSTKLAGIRSTLEADPETLARGPVSVLHAIADQVVDEFAEVLDGIADDVDQIELAVFSGPGTNHAERIFKLKREVLEFRGAVDPLVVPLESLVSTNSVHDDELLRPYFRDVHDHVMRVAERLHGLDSLLDAALAANVAQVGMRQNEDMRKISAWVAIIALPTMIAGVYGMNFEHMPELRWFYGYPFALSLMTVSCLVLYRNFKRRKWL